MKLKNRFRNKSVNYILLVVCTLFILSFQSCKRKTGEPLDLKQQYYPTEIGKWVIYDVTEMNHDILHDTSTYQIKEVITGDFIDDEGRLAQRVERYRRDSVNGIWQIEDVWHSVRTTRTAEKIEEDVRFLKMSFPVGEFEEWDGNVYNTMNEWEYYYDSIDYASTIGTLSFDSLVFVRQRSEHNLVWYEQAYEIYAKHIGMVERQLVDLDIRSGVYWEEDSIKGIELYQTAIDYGQD